MVALCDVEVEVWRRSRGNGDVTSFKIYRDTTRKQIQAPRLVLFDQPTP